jgi:hypothetical protein
MDRWKLIAEKEGMDPLVYRYSDHAEFVKDVADFVASGWLVHASHEFHGGLLYGR